MVKEFVNTLLRIDGYIEYRISKFTGNVANGLLFSSCPLLHPLAALLSFVYCCCCCRFFSSLYLFVVAICFFPIVVLYFSYSFLRQFINLSLCKVYEKKNPAHKYITTLKCMKAAQNGFSGVKRF